MPSRPAVTAAVQFSVFAAAGLAVTWPSLVCAKYSAYHLVWIADGVHLAQGVMFAVAAIALLRWIESGATPLWWASLLFYVLSVLVREDSLAIAPVLIALAQWHGRQQHDWPAPRRGVSIYSAGIIVISVAALLARQVALPADDDTSWTALPYLAMHALARGGPLAAATPPARRDAVLAELRELGIGADCGAWLDSYGRLTPDARLPDGVFVPPARFLSRYA